MRAAVSRDRAVSISPIAAVRSPVGVSVIAVAMRPTTSNTFAPSAPKAAGPGTSVRTCSVADTRTCWVASARPANVPSAR